VEKKDSSSPEKEPSARPSPLKRTRTAGRAPEDDEEEEERPKSKPTLAERESGAMASTYLAKLDESRELDEALTAEERAFRDHIKATADTYPERRSHIYRVARFIGSVSLYRWASSRRVKNDIDF
jgi:hypothetical protein